MVRRLFQLTIEGKGPYDIARILFDDTINTPAVYFGKQNKGIWKSKEEFLSLLHICPDGKTVEALSKGSRGQYSAVLQNSFRFAVFPKRLITFNPMQYVVKRVKDCLLYTSRCV